MSYSNLIYTKSYINGEYTSFGNKTFDVLNPATGEVIATLNDGGVESVKKAIDSAHEALNPWKKKTAKERSTILEKWHDLILEHKEAISQIMTLESGKPINESAGEVNYAASFIKWFAEEAKRVYGDIIPGHASDKRIAVIKQPIGVVGAITPWNFPLAMITRKIAPALAAGCSVVVRPTEETPLSGLLLGQLAKEAGFPKGVINIAVGTDSSEMGKALCESQIVKKISFTGSTRVGKILMTQSADTLKKLSLELGGNAPFIVFEDADIDEAVKGAVAAKYRNSGQTCVCVNRFLVHESVYNEFSEKLVSAVKELKIGEGTNPENQIGPLINANAVEKVDAFVKDATSKGAKVLTGGKVDHDNFYAPTVIAEATSEMDFSSEEIFGPVAPLFKFKTDEEAITMANDTIYGLASYFYSQNVSRCWRVSESLEYGMVGINTGLISTEVAPFGGIKASGQGREGSKYGIEDYLEIKYMCFGGIE